MVRSSGTAVRRALNREAPRRAPNNWARRFLGSICTRPTPIEPLSVRPMIPTATTCPADQFSGSGHWPYGCDTTFRDLYGNP
jgi:hypothetical protein